MLCLLLEHSLATKCSQSTLSILRRVGPDKRHYVTQGAHQPIMMEMHNNRNKAAPRLHATVLRMMVTHGNARRAVMVGNRFGLTG